MCSSDLEALCQEEVGAGLLVTKSLAPEPMMRQIGLIYRKDKALSKAALGFIEVTLAYAVKATTQTKSEVAMEVGNGRVR